MGTTKPCCLLGVWLVNLDEMFRPGRVTGDWATPVLLDVFVDARKAENVSATKHFFGKFLLFISEFQLRQ